MASSPETSDEVEFEAASRMDDVGEVFYYEGNVYRGINEEYVDHVQSILDSDFFEEAVDIGLVDTEIADFSLDKFPLVLRHERVDFRTYSMEWPAKMLKDAALMMVDLNALLSRHGYQLKDGHPWNVLFQYCEPKFVDFGSIVPDTEQSYFREEFQKHFLQPLLLKRFGLHGLSDNLLSETDDVWKRLRDSRLNSVYPLWYYRLFSSDAPLYGKLARLRDRVAALDIDCQETEWSEYDQQRPGDDDHYTSKQQAATDLLQRAHSEDASLLDLGCNKGWFSELGAQLGYRVLAVDIDPQSLCRIYKRGKRNEYPILPIKLDISRPTQAHAGDIFPHAFDRIECDVTLSLALLHHLVFTEGFRFEEVVSILSRLTGSYAIVEFIPRDDKWVSEFLTPEHDWYSMDRFLREMKREFSLVASQSSSPAPREMFLFEKK